MLASSKKRSSGKQKPPACYTEMHVIGKLSEHARELQKQLTAPSNITITCLTQHADAQQQHKLCQTGANARTPSDKSAQISAE